MSDEPKVSLSGLLPTKGLTKREIEKALRESGMTSISLKKLSAQRVVGQLLMDAGAVQIARTEYAVANMLRDTVIQKCREALLLTNSVDSIVALSATIGDLLEAKDNNTKLALAAALSKLGLESEPEIPARAPPKGAQVLAVQINNTVTQERQEA